jgi:hypothetical protein
MVGAVILRRRRLAAVTVTAPLGDSPKLNAAGSHFRRPPIERNRIPKSDNRRQKEVVSVAVRFRIVALVAVGVTAASVPLPARGRSIACARRQPTDRLRFSDPIARSDLLPRSSDIERRWKSLPLPPDRTKSESEIGQWRADESGFRRRTISDYLTVGGARSPSAGLVLRTERGLDLPGRPLIGQSWAVIRLARLRRREC